MGLALESHIDSGPCSLYLNCGSCSQALRSCMMPAPNFKARAGHNIVVRKKETNIAEYLKHRTLSSIGTSD